MIKNYIKIAFRNLWRQKGYTVINIAGMAAGLAVCLLIGLYVQNELSYDQFHEDADFIYRVVQKEADADGLAWSGPQMGLRLDEDFSQIEEVMRLIDGSSGYGSMALISYENELTGEIKRFNEEGFLYADPGFFSFFTFPLSQGPASEVLSRPGTVVITQSTARKYFGEEGPVGKTIMLGNRFPLEVTGVAVDPPDNSHLDFNFVASYRTFYANQGIPGEINSFWWPPTHTYVKLHPGISVETVNDQLPAFSNRHRDSDEVNRLTLKLQPLTEIWLGPDYRGQQQAGGSIAYIYLFSAVAFFILLLACVNFVNLATARAGNRLKEIGIRKTSGATRRQLILQFLGESILLSFAAIAMALLLTELLLPFFNSIAAKQFIIPFEDGAFWLIVLALILLTGLTAGAYPALYLSGFNPVSAFRNSVGQWGRGVSLRKGLVVFQFAVSIILLVGTAIIYQQLQFTTQAQMGFDKEQIVMLSGSGLTDGETVSRYETLRSELLNHPDVLQVTAASNKPGESAGSLYVWEAEGLPSEPNRQYPAQFVGEDFFEMLEPDIIAGRPLRAVDPSDIGTSRLRTDQDMQTQIMENRAIVINETAAGRLGWTPQEALGKQMRLYISENNIIYQDFRGSIVGVVEDYHTASLHEPIAPVAFMSSKLQDGDYLTVAQILVKFSPGNMQNAMQILNQAWEKIVPERPFEATFLEASMNNLYQKEIRMGKLISAFTILALFIACLGLFGLSAFTAETRTKEIGVRKIMGASAAQIIYLLSFDFVKLVIAGFIIAAPLAWVFTHQWLQNFVYQVDIQWQVFGLVGLAVLLLTLITVSLQSVKAAMMNPVNSLRSE